MYVYWWYLHLLDVQESMWTVTVGADASVHCACPRAALWCDAGSMDRTVKLWDLNAGMQIATSRFQPCGVRALALDQDMLVCSASKACTVLPLIQLCHDSVQEFYGLQYARSSRASFTSHHWLCRSALHGTM